MKKTLTVLMMVLLAAMLIISCDSSTSEPETRTPTTIPAPSKKTYTVTFSTGEGGSDIASQSIKEGSTATKPADPTKEGYYLAAWNTADNKKFDFTNDKITADITLTAVWKKVYTVGEAGPAGGIIFYDVDADNATGNADGLTAYDCGWRYLEAASADLTTKYKWGPADSSYSTKEGIGTGKSNTENLLNAKKSDSTLSFPAAEACADYGNDTEYDDWFLPSKNELNLMYTNLKSKGKGGEWKVAYWSSFEYEKIGAYAQDFRDGIQYAYSRSYEEYVRPIRAF